MFNYKGIIAVQTLDSRSERQRAYKEAMEYLRMLVKKDEPDAVILSAVKIVDQAHKDMVATNIEYSKPRLVK